MGAFEVTIEEQRLRVGDDPSAAAHARQLLADLRGDPQRLDDARILLGELVLAAQYQRAESVEVRVLALADGLRLEVVAPAGLRRRANRFRPAADICRRLIEGLSDRCNLEGPATWCELDGDWAVSR